MRREIERQQKDNGEPSYLISEAPGTLYIDGDVNLGELANAVLEHCAKMADACEEQQERDHGAANTGGAASVAEALRAAAREPIE
ncbi:MAG: hypothetical protein NW206_19630 [Hyphomonadaceae bacterium]|nr:hypothetical protein [Hyphomonadaceae bacterium]